MQQTTLFKWGKSLTSLWLLYWAAYGRPPIWTRCPCGCVNWVQSKRWTRRKFSVHIILNYGYMDCEKVSYSSSFCMAFRKPKQSLLVTKENFVYLVALRWHFQFQICLLWGVIILACLEDFCRFVFWVHNGSSEQFWSNKSKGNCELLNVLTGLSSKKIFPFYCKVILILPIAIFHHFLIFQSIYKAMS